MVGTLQEPKDNFYDRLHKSAILASGIVEFYPDATLVIDNQGSVVAWNRAMEKMTGVSAGDMLGKGDHEYSIPFYGERRPMLVDMVGLPEEMVGDSYMDITIAGDRLEALAIKARLKGRSVVLWSAAARLYGLDDRAAGAIESIRDVTSQKLVEERLKESEEMYRLITNSTNDGIITLDSNGIITYVNPSGQEMLRKVARHIIGRHFTDFVADDYKELVVKKFYRCLTGESIAPFEIEAVDDSGRRLPVELSGGALRLSTGMAAIVAIRDVGERWKARAELKKAKDELERRVEERTAELAKAKEQAELYLSLMGHDINNMNQVAMGYLEIAAGMMKPEEKAFALIGRSLSVLYDNSRLIGNLRTLQRATRNELKLERVDLGAILSQVTSEYSLVPGRKVNISYAPVKGYVMANQLLKDVFSNIVGNAIKHSAGPVNVAIHDSCEKGCHIIKIEDDGPGIPDEMKGRIFSRTGHIKSPMGGGLGLYIVKSLVECFKGGVRVEDRVAGDHSKGCRVVVMLPSAD